MTEELKVKEKDLYRITTYIGEEFGGNGYTEIEFDPYEHAIIIRDSQENEVWFDPDSIKKMINTLINFAEKIK